MNEDRTYEAWLDETNRVVSFFTRSPPPAISVPPEKILVADPDPRPLWLPDPVKQS